MAFSTCRRCGYKFVPKEYANCPKCNAPMAASRLSRFAIFAAVICVAFAVLALLRILAAPHIQVSIQ